MFEWCKKLRKGIRQTPAGQGYDWKLKETWEDYPAPDYKAMHTYCEVAFDSSGRTFYYRTRNPELKVGDAVCVPVGYRGEQRIGTIVSMKAYRSSKAPYPLEKTKYIIGKAEDHPAAPARPAAKAPTKKTDMEEIMADKQRLLRDLEDLQEELQDQIDVLQDMGQDTDELEEQLEKLEEAMDRVTEDIETLEELEELMEEREAVTEELEDAVNRLLRPWTEL